MKRSILSTLAILVEFSHVAVTDSRQAFEFDAEFMPAFNSPSHLTLRSSGDSATLNIKISDTSISVPIDTAVADEFFRQAKSIHYTKNKPEIGLDGCDVELHFSVGGKKVFASSVWSPTRASAPSEDALLRALYKVVEQSHIPSRQGEYLEDLYLYFDNIQPHWKVFDGIPLTVRFNEAFSLDDIPAFQAMVASIPRDREAIFDITKLEGSSLYSDVYTKKLCDEFLKVTKDHAVKWRAGKGWSEQLQKIGIPKDRIIPPTA